MAGWTNCTYSVGVRSLTTVLGEGGMRWRFTPHDVAYNYNTGYPLLEKMPPISPSDYECEICEIPGNEFVAAALGKKRDAELVRDDLDFVVLWHFTDAQSGRNMIAVYTALCTRNFDMFQRFALSGFGQAENLRVSFSLYGFRDRDFNDLPSIPTKDEFINGASYAISKDVNFTFFNG